MPHHKSCAKRLRQAAKDRVRNNATRTLLRQTLKEARDSLEKGEKIDTQSIFSSIDKVSSKGVIHKNRAARLKSRMAKANAKIAAASD